MPVTSSKRALQYLALYTVSTVINNYLPLIGRYTLAGKSNLPATSSQRALRIDSALSLASLTCQRHQVKGRYSFSLASGKLNEPLLSTAKDLASSALLVLSDVLLNTAQQFLAGKSKIRRNGFARWQVQLATEVALQILIFCSLASPTCH